MATLEHIGIAVKDPEKVRILLNDLLELSVYKAETVEREGVRTHFIGAGETKLELLEATDSASPVARFLATRGEGVHHLAFEVKDVSEVIARAIELGLSPLSDDGRPGADGKRIAFFHPRDTHGLLIEVCESVRPDVPVSTPIIAEFGRRRSPAVAIVASRDRGQPDLWAKVAMMVESEFYTVVVSATADEVDLDQRISDHFTDDVPLHVIAETSHMVWAKTYARGSKRAVQSLAECSFQDTGIVLSIEFGPRSGERYSIPPVSTASRGSMRLLARLLVETISPLR